MQLVWRKPNELPFSQSLTLPISDVKLNIAKGGDVVIRRATFRLYPKPIALKKLFYARKLHKDLYNAAIANRKTQYEKFGHSVNYLEQQNSLPAFKEVWPEYKQLGSHTLQATLKRVDLAYQSFFKGLRRRPKFKSIRHYSGWSYPDKAGWKIHTTGDNGYLELTDLKLSIQMRGKTRTWGTPTTCTIVYRHGKWYASITVECTPVRETGNGAIGLDFGVYHAVAMSDGKTIENPKFLAKTIEKIRQVSKQKSRRRAPNFKKKVKASKRWKKAAKKVSKLHTKVANQRRDWVHKVAAQIVSCHSMVATEELNLKGMTKKAKKGNKRKQQKTGLNRSMLDVGIGMLTSAIEYKLQEVDGFLVKVPTKKVKPSQTCPNCHYQKKKDLSERIHQCSECGYQCDRDVAASQVMVSYALGTSAFNRGCQTSTSTPQATGGWGQVWLWKRQKPQSS
ncbi:RNA-guided endonuclease InsQ/TnpB family protein [Aerosakkonema funiforme]|uniref:RNA-guided endonuclease InsQ/TnpB family protein n=1 Tax=Aerosakkonema funiforme TaxID=1246630 RepID=UPI0039AEDC54